MGFNGWDIVGADIEENGLKYGIHLWDVLFILLMLEVELSIDVWKDLSSRNENNIAFRYSGIVIVF